MRVADSNRNRGFTLIELLIVIAVIGVLAAVILVAIDPLQQLARARDAGRRSDVETLGKAEYSYLVSKGVWSPINVAGPTWQNNLVAAGELKFGITAPSGTSCNSYATYGAGGFCYNFGTNAIIYIAAESKSERAKCATGQGTFIAWSSLEGKTGIACTTNPTTDPVVDVMYNLK